MTSRQFLSLTGDEIAGTADYDLSLAGYQLICAPIAGMKMERAQDRVRDLPPLVRPLYTTLVLQSEVENGGFNQYFWNSSGRLVPEALEDLQRLGARRHASLLRKAIAIEKQEQSMMAEFKKPQDWESFAESYRHTALEKLDRQFYKLPKLDTIRAEYIRRSWRELQVFFQA